MKNFVLLLLSVVFLFACEKRDGDAVETKTAAVETFNPEAYILTDMPGSPVKKVQRKAADGSVLEEGFLRDGKRTGAWVVFHPNSVVPKMVISFQDDKYQGVYLEFNDRGYLELRAEYKDNLLDGPWARYRFGRPTNEATYRNGKLHGLYREYMMNTGELQKEISYADGVMNGPYRFYNPDGKVTLEYEYRNGERVGGGIIDPAQPNEPR